MVEKRERTRGELDKLKRKEKKSQSMSGQRLSTKLLNSVGNQNVDRLPSVSLPNSFDDDLSYEIP